MIFDIKDCSKHTLTLVGHERSLVKYTASYSCPLSQSQYQLNVIRLRLVALAWQEIPSIAKTLRRQWQAPIDVLIQDSTTGHASRLQRIHTHTHSRGVCVCVHLWVSKLIIRTELEMKVKDKNTSAKSIRETERQMAERNWVIMCRRSRNGAWERRTGRLMVTEWKCGRGRRRVSGLRGWMRTGEGEGTAETYSSFTRVEIKATCPRSVINPV